MHCPVFDHLQYVGTRLDDNFVVPIVGSIKTIMKVKEVDFAFSYHIHV